MIIGARTAACLAVAVGWLAAGVGPILAQELDELNASRVLHDAPLLVFPAASLMGCPVCLGHPPHPCTLSH